jgi:HSP20 family molecular chaperone IbpA
VHGEIKEKERTGVLRHRTRRTGRFGYRVTLPQDTDEEHVSAERADGVLTVTVPRPRRPSPGASRSQAGPSPLLAESPIGSSRLHTAR